MPNNSYDSSRASLFKPGEAEDFFTLGAIDFFEIITADNEAALCAEMARLAYVKEEGRLEIYLKRAGFIKNMTLGYGGGGTQVFVATRESEQLTVISFRGTEADDRNDLFSDAGILLTPWRDSSGVSLGMVHHGFAEALKESGAQKQVVECVKELAQANRILITGHSLGAALATLCASQIEPAHLYTFGSCRVGDAAFAEAMKKIPHGRFVDCCDVVTRVPPVELGYVHAGVMRYVDGNGVLKNKPDCEEIDVDRFRSRIWYLVHRAWLIGNVFFRGLADHAPINYVTGVMGVRRQSFSVRLKRKRFLRGAFAAFLKASNR